MFIETEINMIDQEMNVFRDSYLMNNAYKPRKKLHFPLLEPESDFLQCPKSPDFQCDIRDSGKISHMLEDQCQNPMLLMKDYKTYNHSKINIHERRCSHQFYPTSEYYKGMCVPYLQLPENNQIGFRNVSFIDFPVENSPSPKMSNTYNPINTEKSNKPDDESVNFFNGKKIMINPKELGFLPKYFWKNLELELGQIIDQFFKIRSTKRLRFEYKLWNALAITKVYPDLYDVIGVLWVSEVIIKVNRTIFGSLIKVASPAAALFNHSGSFATHGFLEISLRQVKGYVPENVVDDVDESIVRLYIHSTNSFTLRSSENDISNCKWVKANSSIDLNESD